MSISDGSTDWLSDPQSGDSYQSKDTERRAKAEEEEGRCVRNIKNGGKCQKHQQNSRRASEDDRE